MNTINHTLKREEFFIELYKKAFPIVAKFIANRGGNFNEAKDIFHDALVIYYEKNVAGSLPVNTNETAYLVGIAKHLWFKRFNNNVSNISLDDFDVADINITEEASAQRIINFL